MNLSGTSKALIGLLLFLAAIVALISPALINGYPLVYSDTGTYLYSGHAKFVPVDRPIAYGLFVRHISLSFSLWFVIIVQALFVWSVVLLVFKNLLGIRTYVFSITAITIVILSLCTSLSNYVSQIMPDIFSAIMILSFALLVKADDLNIFIKGYLAMLILLACLFHTSNLITITMLFFVYLLIAAVIGKHKLNVFKTQSIFVPALVIACTWFVYPAINFKYGAGFGYSRSANIFHFYNFLETGVIEQYLRENCDNKSMPLCDYKDKLPTPSWQFLWDQQNSPLYDANCLSKGWGECWLVKDKEFEPIVDDILSTPKYLFMVIASCLKETGQQLLTYNIGHLTPMMEGLPILRLVRENFPDEFQQYISSRQAKETQWFATINSIQEIFIPFSLLFILSVVIIFYKKLRVYYEFIFIIILGLVCNAAACSFFANMVDRYQSRVIWLIPFVAIFLLFFLLKNKIDRNSVNLVFVKN